MIRYPTIPIPVPARIFYGWIIVATSICINISVSTLNPVVFSFFIGPMSSDLGVSRGVLSLAITCRLLLSGVTSPFVGVAMDKYGPRWLGAFGGLVAAASLVALAFTHQIWWVLIAFAVGGAVGLGGGPGGNLVTTVPIAKFFIAKRGRAMSWGMVGAAGGTVVAIPITQWLIDTQGWRAAWVYCGIGMALLVVPLSILFMRRSPEDIGLKPDGETSTAAVRAKVSSDATTEDWTVKEAIHTPAMWMVLTALMLSAIGMGGTLVHRTAYWSDIGMSPALVSIGTAADPFAVVFSSLAFGMLADRVPTRIMGLIGGMGLALSMVPLIFATPHAYSIFAHNITWGIAAGAFVTVNNTIWPNYFGRRFLGAIRGFTFPIIVAANAISAPLIGFLLGGVMPARLVWTIAACLIALSGLLMFSTRRPLRNAPVAVTA